MTVAQLLERTSGRELTEWMAYYQLAPFGEERGDVRAGVVASTIANVHRGQNAKPFTPADFMPFRDPDDVKRERVREIRLNEARLEEMFERLLSRQRRARRDASTAPPAEEG